MTTPLAFFLQNAGYSYDPAKETAAQGRYKCARKLAAAEKRALEQGMRFEWSVDEIDSSDISDVSPAWQLWVCCAYMPDARGDYCMVESLCGIDLGRDGTPHNDPYARVVEAELALEHFDI